MRAGIWWGAAALTLLAVSSALRTQGEGTTRIGRRLRGSSIADDKTATTTDEAQPTFRPRSSRRRDDVPARDAVKTRTRRPERPEATTETPKPIVGRNERFDSRKTNSRSRSRHIESNVNTNTTPHNRDHITRSRSRTTIQRTSSSSSTTQSPSEVSSPIIDESRLEVISSNLEDISKVNANDDKIETVNVNSQFRRRSSTTQTTEIVQPTRLRGRINSRPNARSLDLDISGTTNTLTTAEKEPTTIRTGDLRNSRKLRYKTRLSETDTNLTGEGLKTQGEVVKSSQNEENIASQPEAPTSAAFEENSIQQSTEGLPLKSTTLKVMKMVRRPLTRGTYRPAVPVSKVKTSDEINDDDNYPESFKALIQAKNASVSTTVSKSSQL